jgi:hypothetical protein
MGNGVFYDPGFRTVLETHIPFLRAPQVSRRMPISPDKIYQFEGDFYGLLSDLDIPMEHHWVYLRVNGFHSPVEFGTQAHDPYAKRVAFDLILPAADALRDLAIQYQSTRQ